MEDAALYPTNPWAPVQHQQFYQQQQQSQQKHHQPFHLHHQHHHHHHQPRHGREHHGAGQQQQQQQQQLGRKLSQQQQQTPQMQLTVNPYHISNLNQQNLSSPTEQETKRRSLNLENPSYSQWEGPQPGNAPPQATPTSAPSFPVGTSSSSSSSTAATAVLKSRDKDAKGEAPEKKKAGHPKRRSGPDSNGRAGRHRRQGDAEDAANGPVVAGRPVHGAARPGRGAEEGKGQRCPGRPDAENGEGKEFCNVIGRIDGQTGKMGSRETLLSLQKQNNGANPTDFFDWERKRSDGDDGDDDDDDFVAGDDDGDDDPTVVVNDDEGYSYPQPNGYPERLPYFPYPLPPDLLHPHHFDSRHHHPHFAHHPRLDCGWGDDDDVDGSRCSSPDASPSRSPRFGYGFAPETTTWQMQQQMLQQHQQQQHGGKRESPPFGTDNLPLGTSCSPQATSRCAQQQLSQETAAAAAAQEHHRQLQHLRKQQLQHHQAQQLHHQQHSLLPPPLDSIPPLTTTTAGPLTKPPPPITQLPLPALPPCANQTDFPPANPKTVKDHFLLSLLATLFCCVPLGLVALVYSNKCRKAKHLGHNDSAVKWSRKAQTLVKFSLMLGFICGNMFVLIVCFIYLFPHSSYWSGAGGDDGGFGG